MTQLDECMKKQAVKSEKRGAEKLAISVDEAGERIGLSRTSIWRAVNAGEIPSIRIGGRVLIPLGPLERLLAGE
jgi:excisionase family DNA binding protein